MPTVYRAKARRWALPAGRVPADLCYHLRPDGGNVNEALLEGRAEGTLMDEKNAKGDQQEKPERELQGGAWPSGRAVVAMSRQILHDHYVTRDIDAVMRHMAPDITWIGPLACQRARSAEDMRRLLEPEYGTPVEMFDDTWGFRAVGGARMVVGTYGARVPGSAAASVEFLQSATFVWAMTPAGPRVVHLHLSNAYDVPARLDAPAPPDDNAVDYVVDVVAPPAAGRERLRFEMPGGEVRYVADDRVLCLDAAEVGCTAVCEGGSFAERERLAHVAERLPSCFVQVHRSCIVNARRVTAMRRFEVVLDDGSTRPVAERRYLEVAEAVERAAGRSLREG